MPVNGKVSSICTGVVLQDNPELYALFAADSELIPSIPTVEDFLSVLEEPPEPDQLKPPSVAEQRAIYITLVESIIWSGKQGSGHATTSRTTWPVRRLMHT